MKTTSVDPVWKASITLVVGLLATLVLIVHARSYLPLFIDDAFISLRYAMRLLQGHGLTWTDGEAVEGYSNLLWVLGCAALGALGLNLVDAARVLGMLCGILTIAALLYAFPPRGWRDSLPALAGTMFIALAGPIAIWATAGLEGCMLAALLAWGLALLRPLLDGAAPKARTTLLPGIPLALLCLTRSDAPLIVVTICAFLLIRAESLRKGLTTALAVGVLPGLATLGQLVFRLAYYGEWVPNTAHAKVAFSSARISHGIECVEQASFSSYALWLPASLAIFVAWRDRTRRTRILLAAVLLTVWTGYTVSITCWTFGYRMLIPCVVLLTYMAAEALDWVITRGSMATAAAWIVTSTALVVFGWAQQNDKNITLARSDWTQSLTRKGASVGLLLRRAFADRDPLVAVDAAGAIPYFSQLRSLDMLGLNDANIARRRPPGFGQGLQGHELGDGSYVLERQPDIVIGGILGSSGLSYLGGRELKADPRFANLYRLTKLYADDPLPVTSSVYILLEGRVGVRRDETAVRIPGYLFATTEGSDARFGASGTLGTVFRNSLPARLTHVELPRGLWRFTTAGTGPFMLSVRTHRTGELVSGRGGMLNLAMDEAGPVDVIVSGNPSAFLSAVIATRSVE